MELGKQSGEPENAGSVGTAAWYLLKTKPRVEALASHSLEDNKISTYLPRLLVRKQGRKELEAVPLFPGYLFFQLEYTSHLWGFVRWATGVSYVLSDETGPIPLPDQLIDEIRTREQRKIAQVTAHYQKPFEKNEILQIISGPFSGLDGVFEKNLSANGRVQVLVQLLGGITRVTVDASALSRAG